MIQPLIQFDTIENPIPVGMMRCPGGVCGRQGFAQEPEANFSQTQVTVVVCPTCQATGIHSVTLVKSALVHFLRTY